MAGHLPSPLNGGPGMLKLEVVTSVPFGRRAAAVRAQHYHQQAQRPRQGLFRLLLGLIAVGGATTLLVSWYTQRELPVAQRRAKDSDALLAPPSQSFCRRTRPPMVCAHGGDTTHAPPNTVSAFRASLAGGADCVEVDAALSRDGVLVVMHVRELAQLLGRGGVQVGDMHSRELLALRWPSGEAVMAVEEAVRLTAPFVSCVTLDVKTYNDKSGQPLDELAIAEALVGLVTATRCANCLIWAKSDRVVRRVLELAPGQRTGYIVMNETEESRQLGMHQPLRFAAAPAHPQPTIGSRQPELLATEPVAGGDAPVAPHGADTGALVGEGLEGHHHQRPHRRLRQPGLQQYEDGVQEPKQQPVPRQPLPYEHLQPGVVGVHHAMVEPELLDVLHGAGKQLFAWTINQAEVLRAVLDVGVDAVVTNYPLTALAAIDARLAKCEAILDAGRGSSGTPGRGSASVRKVLSNNALPGDYL